MNTIQLAIEANEEQQEILIGDLSELNAEGFEQTPGVLLAYFNEHNFKSYEVNQVLASYSVTTNVLGEKNWNEVWESNFQPVVVDGFCTIRAEFHEPIKDVEHEIVITPKMSFGTGHHATTNMMVRQMQDINFREKNVFDFGTGTGILAILAEKLGADTITAIDVDTWSIENAKENLLRNDCTKVSVHLSSQIPADKFDVVLANINRNVLLQYLPQLKTCVKGGGFLLISGILCSDEKDIVQAFQEQGLQLIKQSERHNWLSQLYVNPS
jgi:ribosomal protein L11 methyltransferase